MNSHKTCSLSNLFIVFLSILNVVVNGQTKNFIVTDLGAVADDKTDSKEAFANAWNKACQTPGGVVLVPAGKTFLVSGADFVGPCSGNTKFQIDGTLVASNDPKSDGLEYWISFDSVDGLAVVGKGVFDGNGPSSWSRCSKSSNCDNRPATLRFHDVRHAIIGGITLINSKMFHVVIHKSQNLMVRNVNIKAPPESPNTDGIHISNSGYVEIVDSTIGTGDDCISLGDGSTNINITRVACGPGHGISIGSLGKYKNEEDVSGITVSNCSLTGTDNGLRIKTWAPSVSSNVVSDVTYTDINLNNVKNPVIIDQYYCPNKACQNVGESDVQIKGVRYINVRGSSVTETGVSIQCSKRKPCQDVMFSQLNLTLNGEAAIASCSNVDGRFSGSSPSRCSELN